MNLTPYLEDIERRIDERQEEAIYDAWVDFALGNATPGETFRPPMRMPSQSRLLWEHIWVNDALEDEDLMLLSQLERCHAALSAPTDTIMTMRANYGVGNIASMFGARPFIMERKLDTLPNVWPIGGGIDGINRLLDAPEPEMTAGHGKHIFSMGEKFAEIRMKYPKIARFVRIDNPDGQGPMDNCELLWGSEIFYSLYDEPETVHAILRRVTDVLTKFVDAWQKIIPNDDGMASYFGRIGKGGIVIRDDSAMNLSPEFFDEYIKPYDAELICHFGGGIVHFCGRGDHFARNLAQIPGLSTVDMSQPHLNDMEKILTALPDSGINIFCPADPAYTPEGHAKHRIAMY